MDPLVYIIYLCLLENDSELRKSFITYNSRRDRMLKLWEKSTLTSKIHRVIYEKITNYRAEYILEAQRKWNKVSSEEFYTFLEKYWIKK